MLELPLQGALLIGCYIPRAVPWAVENIGLSARTDYTFSQHCMSINVE